MKNIICIFRGLFDHDMEPERRLANLFLYSMLILN